jgi:hypothetical protein
MTDAIRLLVIVALVLLVAPQGHWRSAPTAVNFAERFQWARLSN